MQLVHGSRFLSFYKMMSSQAKVVFIFRHLMHHFCLCVCACIFVSARVWGSEENVRSSEARVAGGCELPSVSPGTELRSFGRAAKTLSH